MGDQRRRSKSKGCQKEQEEQEKGGEEEEVCRRVYTEGAWPLLTVYPGRGGEKRGRGRRTTGEVEGRCRRRAKEK